MESCDSCRFWKDDVSFRFRDVRGPNVGTCRRFPPIPVYCGQQRGEGMIADDFLISHPETSGEHWCGEYQSAEEAGSGD